MKKANARFLTEPFFAWLAWAIFLCAFQSMVVTRIAVRPIDRVLGWTAAETGKGAGELKARLSVPVFAEHVAWDSEFYLSIAMKGYDDPAVRMAIGESKAFSLNYAFMPGYPAAIRLAMQPLLLIGVDARAAAAICALAVSLAGALLATMSLYSLAAPNEGRQTASRAAWFMLIFPSGFFLAQVYAEALFLGLALQSLALARKERWFSFSIVASLAVLTRASGVALVAACAVAIARTLISGKKSGVAPKPAELLGMAEALLVPLAVFLAWKFSYLGQRFDYVERVFFSRALDPIASLRTWAQAFQAALSGPNERIIYYLVEFASLALALVSTVWGARKYPELAIFGLASVVIPLSSIAPQGLIRYVLSCPLIFIMTARWASSKPAERAYTLFSVLCMAYFALLFSLDMWVG